MGSLGIRIAYRNPMGYYCGYDKEGRLYGQLEASLSDLMPALRTQALIV